MGTFINVLLNGLSFSGLLFLIAAGLTLILGLARIVNFAHGSLFLLGGYVFINVAHATGNWWLALLVTPICLAIIGGLIEFLLLRRIYGKEALLQLILTFGLLLIIEDLVKLIWGPVPYNLNIAPDLLSGSIEISNMTIPKNSLGILIVAASIGMLLWLLLYKTRLGKQINAASLDVEMAGALGIDVPRLLTAVFVLGSACAGIGGGLLTLKLGLVPSFGVEYLIYAFAVVVIGGLGSFKGSVCGALIVGICYSFGILIVPGLAMIFVFALLFLTLIVRPRGLFGLVEEIRGPAVAVGKKVKIDVSFFSGRLRGRTLLRFAGIVLFCFILLLPFLSSGFWVVFTIELLIFVLLASSLNMLIRCGMLSLAHAAFFGTGAYTASLILIHWTSSLIVSLVVSMALSAALAFIIGLLSLRHVELYFALLTLAFAQFVYAVYYKWQKVTGGDDGLMGIPLPVLNFGGLTGDVFSPDTAAKYLFLVLILITLSLLALRRVRNSPFGQILLAVRENYERVSFLGLNPDKYKLAAFVMAGCFASLAGALFAPFQMVITPTVAHWTKSVDPIFMNIIGGVNTMLGPGVGAAIFVFFKDWLSSLMEYWRIIFGAILILVAIAFPDGLMEYFKVALAKIFSAYAAPVTGPTVIDEKGSLIGE